MKGALYHPEHGYYTRHAAGVGARGDFSTSATLHPILGQAVGRWLLEQKSGLSLKKPWHVIELGAGGGELARSVLKSIGWWNRRGLHYHIVEASPHFTQTQQAVLRGYPVTWHREIEEALNQTKGEALIFSNEFVDAFPCRVLKNQNGVWNEVCVSHELGIWKELLRPLQVSSEESINQLLDEKLQGLQRIEVHQSYFLWLKRWAKQLHRGAVLTIDYGDVAPELYFRRPGGTLRAYFRHQRIEGMEVFERFGRQDITADVNFSHLIDWGSLFGWEKTRFGTQQEFFLDYCPESGRKADRIPEVAFLMNSEGPGGAFKVLSQTISSL